MSARKRALGPVVGGLITGALLLAGAIPSPLAAQDEVDSRWLPWLGCWEASTGEAETPLVCIHPLAGGEGVELQTWAEGGLTASEAIYTDGLDHEATRQGCEGWESAQFSDDGHRVYLRSNYICEGGISRESTGLLAMANPMEWLDVKVVEVEGQEVPWVLRYRLARASRVEEAGVEDIVAPRAMAVKAARMAAASPLEESDIVEAVGKVQPAAVQALIAERGDRLRLDADMLVRLAEAGVPEDVIDLTVAVSYPDRFQISAGTPEEIPSERSYRGYDPYYGSGYSRWSFWNPFNYRYGLYSPYYYGGYGGYGAYGGYGGYYGGWGGYYRPVTVYVEPRDVDDQPRGRVVNGRGYTRGTTGGSSGGGSRSGGVSSGGASSRSGGVSSSGTRSGGSSSSTGRTAKRRGGGGF
jgi:hypothetical protein